MHTEGFSAGGKSAEAFAFRTGRSRETAFTRDYDALAGLLRLIDGPLQYDAAVMADVAKSKAPNSPVAGRAT